jgi:hypothetical protein
MSNDEASINKMFFVGLIEITIDGEKEEQGAQRVQIEKPKKP